MCRIVLQVRFRLRKGVFGWRQKKEVRFSAVHEREYRQAQGEDSVASLPVVQNRSPSRIQIKEISPFGQHQKKQMLRTSGSSASPRCGLGCA